MPDQYRSTRAMTDDEVVERVQADFKQAKSDKAADNKRCLRYKHIYEALDNPEEIVDEDTGRLADDRRIYSNTYLPIGAAVVDAAVATLYNAFFSVPDYFEIAAEDYWDNKAAGKIKGPRSPPDGLLLRLCRDYGLLGHPARLYPEESGGDRRHVSRADRHEREAYRDRADVEAGQDRPEQHRRARLL